MPACGVFGTFTNVTITHAHTLTLVSIPALPFQVFGRLGMNAKETVALIGAHTIGRAFKVLPSSLGVVLLQTGKHACKSTHNFVAPCFVFCFFLCFRFCFRSGAGKQTMGMARKKQRRTRCHRMWQEEMESAGSVCLGARRGQSAGCTLITRSSRSSSRATSSFCGCPQTTP